ncbi:MAG: hypothetical protein IPL21_00915 [Saprospirales bacterium]|nr:hypothetical protein [Saprospirales bacterium]
MQKSFYTTILCSLFLFISTFFTHRWNEKNNAVLSYDAAGYYLYLPSFFYDDLGKINNKDAIIQNYNPFGCNFDDANKKIGDNYILKYTCGIAILEFPAFVIAHFIAKFFSFPVDGFSLPYQICINFWSILFGVFGLWILRKVLLKYFSDNTVAITIFTLCVATNLYNFISFSGNMSHCYLFTLYALILFYTDKFYKKPTLYVSFLLGLIAGLVVMIRPIEIICLFIIFGWKIDSFSDIKSRILFFKKHIAKFILFVIAAILIGSIQLFYWKIYSGHWLFWSYGENESFNFIKPHLINWMISYKKGWLTYTPVMVLSLFGFYSLYKNHKSLFIACFLFTVFNIYLCSAWNCWWYGGSFSQRSVVQSYAILAFPLAAFFQSISNKKILFYFSLLFVVFCCWLNILMTYQAYTPKGIMENELMSKKYFWKIFGKTTISKSDKKYIDLRDEVPVSFQNNLASIYSNNFENEDFGDTCQASSGKKAILLNKHKQNSPEVFIPIKTNNYGYYRATINVFANGIEWNIWNQTQWIITLYNNEEVVRSNFYRIYRIIEPNSWQPIFIDIKTPRNKKYNKLSIKFWHANSEKQVQFDDLNVSFVPY